MSDEPETVETEEVAPTPTPEETANVPMKIPPLGADMESRGILPIIPRDTAEAQRYATGMIQAGIVPDCYRFDGKRDNEINAPLVLMGVLKSLEIGLPPQTGIGTIMPINNRFTVWGDGAIALVQQKNVLTSFMQVEIGPTFDKTLPIGEWPSEYGWRVSILRRHQVSPYIGEFTIGDAKRANLWMNAHRKPWINYPIRMLFNRARAFAIRDGFADCLMGLGIREEIEDMLISDPDAPQRQLDTSFLDDEGPINATAEDTRPAIESGEETSGTGGSGDAEAGAES